MAIRFPCPQCGRLLRTASRKVGVEIQCPKCGFLQTVPNEETAALAQAMGRRRKKPASSVDFRTTLAENNPAAARESVAVRGTTPPHRPAAFRPPPLPGAARLGPNRRSMRRTYQIEAILFPVVAVVAFVAGYLIGRGDASSEFVGKRETTGSDQVLLEGRLVYDPGTVRLTGDSQSVVIVLPKGRFPEQPWSPYGIRPGDSPPADSDLTLRAIRNLGGAYVQTDASGEFSAVLPVGEYRILLISRHASRPPDGFVDELDRTQIGQYFSDPAELLRTSKYRWMSQDLKVGVDAPVEQNFGRDGKA